MDMIHAICHKRGATIHGTVVDGRTMTVKFSLKNVDASISLRGKTPHTYTNTFVIPWHIAPQHNQRFTHTFGVLAGGEVNSVHFHKCTAVNYGFDSLCARLDATLESINNGTGVE